jgi:hypothetical protein
MTLRSTAARDRRAPGLKSHCLRGTVEHGRERTAIVEARRAWASLGSGPFPWTDQQVTDAVQWLAESAAEYRRAGVLDVDWPDSLCSPVPTGPGVKRGRRGRR